MGRGRGSGYGHRNPHGGNRQYKPYSRENREESTRIRSSSRDHYEGERDRRGFSNDRHGDNRDVTSNRRSSQSNYERQWDERGLRSDRTRGNREVPPNGSYSPGNYHRDRDGRSFNNERIRNRSYNQGNYESESSLGRRGFNADSRDQSPYQGNYEINSNLDRSRPNQCYYERESSLDRIGFNRTSDRSPYQGNHETNSYFDQRGFSADWSRDPHDREASSDRRGFYNDGSRDRSPREDNYERESYDRRGFKVDRNRGRSPDQGNYEREFSLDRRGFNNDRSRDRSPHQGNYEREFSLDRRGFNNDRSRDRSPHQGNYEREFSLDRRGFNNDRSRDRSLNEGNYEREPTSDRRDFTDDRNNDYRGSTLNRNSKNIETSNGRIFIDDKRGEIQGPTWNRNENTRGDEFSNHERGNYLSTNSSNGRYSNDFDRSRNIRDPTINRDENTSFETGYSKNPDMNFDNDYQPSHGFNDHSDREEDNGNYEYGREDFDNEKEENNDPFEQTIEEVESANETEELGKRDNMMDVVNIKENDDQQVVEKEESPEFFHATRSSGILKFQRKTRVIFESNLPDNVKEVAVFLSFILFGAYQNRYSHCYLLQEDIFSSRYPMKLLWREVSSNLNKNFESDSRKSDFLAKKKVEVLEDTKNFLPNQTAELILAREKMMNECIEVLIAKVLPDVLPGVDMTAVENILTEAELRQQFKYALIKYIYQAFGYKLLNQKASTERVLNFHNENNIIPCLLVAFVRSYVFKSAAIKPGDSVVLPRYLEHHLEPQKEIGYLRSLTYRHIYMQQYRKNEHLQTNVLRTIPRGQKIATRVLLDFSNSILLFDAMMTVVRYKALNFTNSIDLKPNVKMEIFDELLRSIYHETFELWQCNGGYLDGLVFKPMTI